MGARRAAGLGTLGIVVSLLVAGPVLTVRAAAVDAMVLTATFGNVNPPVILAVAGGSTFSITGSCTPTFPSFVSTDDGLPAACPNLTGAGSYSNVVCGTGTMAGTLNITEPAGESATATFTMVLIAGLGVLEGSYADDSGRVAIGVATVIPQPPSSCVSGVTVFSAQILLVGAG